MPIHSEIDLTSVASSYQKRNLGELLYGLVRSHKPRVVVELGAFLGYSGLHIAAALRDNADVESRFELVDAWDKYPYRHCNKSETAEEFARNGLLQLSNCLVTLTEEEAFDTSVRYEDQSVDFLHIDLSNTGDSLRRLLEQWRPKMSDSADALIAFEGGSNERDGVEWMHKYGMRPIRSLLESEWLNQHFEWFCFEPFPSLTVLRRRIDTSA